jgi:hypothetical protein
VKRVLALGVVLSLLLVGAPTSAAPLSGTFTDDDGNIHEPNIQSIAAAGITLGCGQGRYCPADTVRRDQMASFLARALGLAPLASGPFGDVTGNPHAGAINAIAAAGVTLGCGQDAYCPGGLVRRDQMASFLTRAFRLAASPSPFADTAGNVHEADIGAIAAAGITLGCGPNRYCPAGLVRRDEMASFLARALDLEPVYVLLGMAGALPVTCSKDGLTCTGSFAIPNRPAYRVSEGFYHVLPFAGGEQAEFETSSTRFEILVDGVTQSLAEVTAEGDGSVERRFEGTIALAPGNRQVIGRWFWNGSPVQTTVLNLTVSG